MLNSQFLLGFRIQNLEKNKKQIADNNSDQQKVINKQIEELIDKTILGIET